MPLSDYLNRPRYQGILAQVLREKMAAQPEPEIPPGTGALEGLAAWGRRVQAGPDINTIPMVLAQILREKQGGEPVDPALREKAMGQGMAFAPFGMTAWHGSPHKFAPVAGAPLGKFDLSKVGSGEGAQAYGHGLYLAENPATSRVYANQLPGSKPTVTLSTGETFAYETPQAKALLGMPFKTVGEAQIRYSQLNKEFPDKRYAHLFDTVKDLPSNAKINQGNLYKVDLPDEQIAKMLDWDKPLSQQPESVRKLIASDKMVQDAIAELRQIHGPNANIVGGDLYRAMEKQGAASKWLNDLGIPGIKYLDQGSRTKGEGTRNFVIFDPEIAKIIGRE